MAILEQVEKIPLKQRAIVLGALVVMIAVVFFYLVYQPKAKLIASNRTQLAKLTTEVQGLRAIEAKNKEFQKMIADLRGQLDSARQQLPGEREIPKLLEEIAHFGKEAGIDLGSFRPTGEKKKDFYTEVPMSLAFRGPYHNVGLFLDKLSHYPRIISVSNLSMGSPKEKEGYLMLTATCVATTYRYVE